MLNLQGRTYMPSTDCPFRKADALLAALPAGVNVRFVDFHAELTSEKQAMGWYLDGRVSAVVGTHTHVPTADARVLPGGTFGNFPGEVIIREGKGGRVWDEDGKEYVDYLLGSGPMLVGHAHPEVTEAAPFLTAVCAILLNAANASAPCWFLEH